MLLVLVMTAIWGVVFVLPAWFICRKAGLHPALSIFAVIPLGPILFLYILAFCRWPALRPGSAEAPSPPDGA